MNYEPLVVAVVGGWRRETGASDPHFSVGEEHLRDLIARMTKTLEILAASRELAGLFCGTVSERPQRGSALQR